MVFLWTEQCYKTYKVLMIPVNPPNGPGQTGESTPESGGLLLMAPIGYVTNLWPWLPPGWIGRCTTGLAFAHGNIMSTIQEPLNLPSLRARGSQSVFYWYNYLAAIFVPSLGTMDKMIRVEALTNFTQRALNDSLRAIQALNTEQIQMRKSVIQNRMALDILTAAQGGTCAIIKGECCVYIPDLSGNISVALDDMKDQVKAMSDDNLPFWTSVLS